MFVSILPIWAPDWHFIIFLFHQERYFTVNVPIKNPTFLLESKIIFLFPLEVFCHYFVLFLVFVLLKLICGCSSCSCSSIPLRNKVDQGPNYLDRNDTHQAGCGKSDPDTTRQAGKSDPDGRIFCMDLTHWLIYPFPFSIAQVLKIQLEDLYRKIYKNLEIYSNK